MIEAISWLAVRVVVIGLICWLVSLAEFIPDGIKKAFYGVVLAIFLIYALQHFGSVSGLKLS